MNQIPSFEAKEDKLDAECNDNEVESDFVIFFIRDVAGDNGLHDFQDNVPYKYGATEAKIFCGIQCLTLSAPINFEHEAHRNDE